MTRHNMSLVDILKPPRNNWLRQLRRKNELPAGVRVVRFSDYDDDTEVAEAVSATPARTATEMKAQVA